LKAGYKIVESRIPAAKSSRLFEDLTEGRLTECAEIDPFAFVLR